ncbi:hypothetical protein Mapa_004460 [Marchantia paleacea]|nr:hypothetical protein Mapa_004460 [Marchantia paleacea]
MITTHSSVCITTDLNDYQRMNLNSTCQKALPSSSARITDNIILPKLSSKLKGCQVLSIHLQKIEFREARNHQKFGWLAGRPSTNNTISFSTITSRVNILLCSSRENYTTKLAMSSAANKTYNLWCFRRTVK